MVWVKPHMTLGGKINWHTIKETEYFKLQVHKAEGTFLAGLVKGTNITCDVIVQDVRSLWNPAPQGVRIIMKNYPNCQVAVADTIEDMVDQHWLFIHEKIVPKLKLMKKEEVQPYLNYLFTKLSVEKNTESVDTPTPPPNANQSNDNNNNDGITDSQAQYFQKVDAMEAEQEDKDLCKICFEKKVETAIVDCGHSVLCMDCSKLNLQNCPICRQPIVKIIKLYKS